MKVKIRDTGKGWTAHIIYGSKDEYSHDFEVPDREMLMLVLEGFFNYKNFW